MPRFIRHPKEIEGETAIVAGSFDGIHLGHRYLIDRTVQVADTHGLLSLLITFDPHPAHILLPPEKRPPLLTTRSEKKFLLQSTPLDDVYFHPFDPSFAAMSGREYLRYLKNRFGMACLILGYDHKFGSDRLGDVALIRKIGEAYGFRVMQAGVYEWEGIKVSSSVIRHLIREGAIRRANRLLGYHYLLSGTVVHGSRFGRRIGFPTANIQPENPMKLIPPPGVYYVKTLVENQWHKAVMNIGNRPTVDGGRRQIEIHIPGFEGNLYGKHLYSGIIDYLRPEIKFENIENLRRQIASDIEQIKQRELE